MKKMRIMIGIFTVILLVSSTDVWATSAPEGEVQDIFQKISITEYMNLKKKLKNRYGLDYSLTFSYLGQRGLPHGKDTSWQTQYDGSIDWTFFRSNTWGNGSVQLGYDLIQYWGNTAQNIGERIGIVSSINDDPVNAAYFDQLSYTHSFESNHKIFSLLIGQYPLSNYDGGDFNANQQVNFLNEALSQNGSSTYPSNSLGAVATISDAQQIFSLAIGGQDAQNVSGTAIHSRHLNQKEITTFGCFSYHPVFSDGRYGQYSVLVYHQPSVSEQPGTSTGWSFNLQQYMSQKSVVFGRLNGVSNTNNLIEQSYVIGGVYLNPFERNELDQIGLALAVNKINKSALQEGTVTADSPDGVCQKKRRYETVLEAYYAFGVSSMMTITPDVQFYIHPGKKADQKTATTFSIRTTLLF